MASPPYMLSARLSYGSHLAMFDRPLPRHCWCSLTAQGNSVYGLRRWRNGKDIEKDGDHALARSVRALLLKAWAQSRTTILVERISKGKRVLEKAKQSSAPKGQWETYVITISISLAACGSTANRRHRAM